jgi:hypothetical protein
MALHGRFRRIFCSGALPDIQRRVTIYGEL